MVAQSHLRLLRDLGVSSPDLDPLSVASSAPCSAQPLRPSVSKHAASQTELKTVSQALRFAVGLLGLEVHAKPCPWAEAWLEYSDSTITAALSSAHALEREGSACLALAPPDNPSASLEAAIATGQHPAEGRQWQLRVLEHLQNYIVPPGTRCAAAAAAAAAGASGVSTPTLRQGLASGPMARPQSASLEERSLEAGASATFSSIAQADSQVSTVSVVQPSRTDDWGPDWAEYMELAHFILGRITRAVWLLDKDKHQPITLREYTEKMVHEVSVDLKQWLEQISVLFSIYHVHLLDMAKERRQLMVERDAVASKQTGVDAARKNAVLRHDRIKAMWDEDKMKRRAQSLFGAQLGDESNLIYSQQDVDEMKKDWERRYVKPLLEEIRSLKSFHKELMEKLRKAGVQASAKSAAAEDEAETTGPSDDLRSCIVAAASREQNRDMRAALLKLAESLAGSEEVDVKKVLRDINSLPIPGEMYPLSPCLDAVSGALASAAERLSKAPVNSGADSLARVLAWSCSTLSLAKDACSSVEGVPVHLQWPSPPTWDMAKLSEMLERASRPDPPPLPPPPAQGPAAAGVAKGLPQGGGAAEGVRQRSQEEDDYRRRMEQMLADLQAQLAAAKAQTSKTRDEAELALQQVGKQSRKADSVIEDVRGRVRKMKDNFDGKGLGRFASDAMNKAGLDSLLNDSSNVFERLYQDALDRMRRHAEAQAEVLERGTQEFMRIYESVYSTAVTNLQMFVWALGDGREEPLEPAPVWNAMELLASVPPSPSQDPPARTEAWRTQKRVRSATRRPQEAFHPEISASSEVQGVGMLPGATSPAARLLATDPSRRQPSPDARVARGRPPVREMGSLAAMLSTDAANNSGSASDPTRLFVSSFGEEGSSRVSGLLPRPSSQGELRRPSSQSSTLRRSSGASLPRRQKEGKRPTQSPPDLGPARLLIRRM